MAQEGVSPVEGVRLGGRADSNRSCTGDPHFQRHTPNTCPEGGQGVQEALELGEWPLPSRVLQVLQGQRPPGNQACHLVPPVKVSPTRALMQAHAQRTNTSHG